MDDLHCHNCELDVELTTAGYALGSDEKVYQCVDPREVDGLLDDPCLLSENHNCFVDPREID